MRLGIWCPAPLSIRPDSLVQPAFDALTRHGGGVDQNYLYAVDVLRRAEELGFEITLIAQRFFGPDLDSWMLAAALAAQTTSIEIMAAVHPGIIDPKVVAKHAASLDRISGGRFCVNIVNGSRPQEFEVFGKLLASGEARYRRMHEFIQVMKGMWLHDDFKFHGDFYSVEYGTVPTKSVRVPHPPIYAASRVDEGMNVVAQECDAWFVNSSRHYSEYEDGLKRVETEVGLMERRCREPRSSRRRSRSAPTSSVRPRRWWSESAAMNRSGSICSCCSSIRCVRASTNLRSRFCLSSRRARPERRRRRPKSRYSCPNDSGFVITQGSSVIEVVGYAAAACTMIAFLP